MCSSHSELKFSWNRLSKLGPVSVCNQGEFPLRAITLSRIANTARSAAHARPEHIIPNAARSMNASLDEWTGLIGLSLIFFCQHALDSVVVPDITNASALAFPALFDKTAGAITAYRALIKCQDP